MFDFISNDSSTKDLKKLPETVFYKHFPRFIKKIIF